MRSLKSDEAKQNYVSSVRTFTKRATQQFQLLSFIMTGIEDIAVSWLADPAWQKVFKHTVDIFQDYVSYVLVRFYML